MGGVLGLLLCVVMYGQIEMNRRLDVIFVSLLDQGYDVQRIRTIAEEFKDK